MKKKTKTQKNKQVFSDFSKWLNKNPNLDSRTYKLDIQDLDFIIHQYGNIQTTQLSYIDDKIRKVMLIEEKAYMHKQDFAQKDTHRIIDQCLHNTHNKTITTYRGERILQYYGYHLISFENTSPNNGKTFINYQEVDKEYLEAFLRFELDLQEYQCFFCKNNK